MYLVRGTCRWAHNAGEGMGRGREKGPGKERSEFAR